MSLNLPSPYLLFLGDVTEPLFAKTAYGLRDWALPSPSPTRSARARGSITSSTPV
jgi:hypothetical protein